MPNTKYLETFRVKFSDFCSILPPQRKGAVASDAVDLKNLGGLRTQADQDLARRSITGVFSYFVLWLVIYYVTSLQHSSHGLFQILGFLLVAAAIGRLYLALNFRQLHADNPRRWGRLFTVGTIAASAIWGGVAANAIYYDGLGTTAILVMLPTAGIAAGGIVSLAPAPKLGGLFLLVLLLPSIAVAALSGNQAEEGIALLFLIFVVVMTLMWRRLHHEYWNALFTRAELLRAKEAAEAASQAKGQFIASVSHELRTPLTSVIGALGMISEYPPDGMPTEAMVLVDMAYRNGKRLSILVNDILDFEKLDAHQMQFNIQPVELTAFLNRAIDLNEIYSDRYQVTFIVQPPAAGLTVRADESRLMQVMTNLLSNAAKHSRPETKVLVSAREVNGVARISVIDHGPGVPDDFRSHIFERFAQAHQEHSGKKEGTGLGLAISKAIIEQMGGKIGFDSVFGQGATFWFELPLAAAAGQPEEEEGKPGSD